MAHSSEDHMKQYLSNFFEAVSNFFIFLPYFFSVSALLKTLFVPWKNITDSSKLRGFSFEALFNKVLFNVISVGIGFGMRTSILLFFFLVVCLYVLLLPAIGALFIVSLPFAYLLFSVKESEYTHKAKLKERFVRTHLLNNDHYQEVKEEAVEYVTLSSGPERNIGTVRHDTGLEIGRNPWHRTDVSKDEDSTESMSQKARASYEVGDHRKEGIFESQERKYKLNKK